MVREVTDPAILSQLESGPREVTDLSILSQLEGTSSMGWGEAALKGLFNIPGDILNVSKNIWSAVTNPRQALEALSDVGAGAVAKILPESAFKTTPEAQATRARTEQAAEQFGGAYKEAYGGLENIKRSIAKQPVQTLLDVATVASPVSRAIPSLKLGGKALTAEARAAGKLAEEAKLPLSAAALNPSKTAGAFEWVGQALQPGKAWANMKRKQLQVGLTRMMDEAVGRLPKSTEKYEAGVQVAQGLKEAKAGLKAGEKAAYGKWENALGSGGHLMDNTVAAIDKIKEGTKGELRAWLEAYSKKGAGWTSTDVDAFQKQIWSKTWGTDLRGGELLEALKKDLGPEMTALLDEAKESSKLFRAFSANQTVRDVLRRYAQDPENAIRAMFRTGNMEDLNLIKKAVSPEVWDIARSRFIENLFDASTEISGTQRAFNPQKFSDIFSKYQRQIKQVMPEKYDYLKRFADLSKMAVQDLNKISPDTFMSWQTGATSALAGGAAMGNALMVVPMGFSFAISKSIMNPSGWLKKWLTEGFKMPELSRGARRANVLQIGGREAVRQEAQQ